MFIKKQGIGWVRLVGWVEICVDMKDKVEETVKSQEASQENGSKFVFILPVIFLRVSETEADKKKYTKLQKM